MAYNSTKIGRLYLRQQTDYETPFASSDVINPTYAIEGEVFMPPTTREIFERAAVKGGFYEIPPVSGSQHGAELMALPEHVKRSDSDLEVARGALAPSEETGPRILAALLRNEELLTEILAELRRASAPEMPAKAAPKGS